MALRADVAVPSSIAFRFGSAIGLVVGWLVASGGQNQPETPVAGAGQPGQAQASPQQQAASREMQLRDALAMHEELLAKDPENPRLLRTIGEYQAALGDHDAALANYALAKAALAGDPDIATELPELLFDEALSLAEQQDYRKALDLLEEAAAMEPENVAPRLIQVYIYMRRIMPAPPPGFDRLEALKAAEVLLDEILTLDPANPEARQMKDAIDSVRASRQAPATQPSGGDEAP